MGKKESAVFVPDSSAGFCAPKRFLSGVSTHIVKISTTIAADCILEAVDQLRRASSGPAMAMAPEQT